MCKVKMCIRDRQYLPVCFETLNNSKPLCLFHWLPSTEPEHKDFMDYNLSLIHISMEDNELTEAERNALMEEYMQYMDEALALRDNLAAATGYDTTQQGLSLIHI